MLAMQVARSRHAATPAMRPAAKWAVPTCLAAAQMSPIQPQDSRSNRQHRFGTHRGGYRDYPLYLVPYYPWWISNSTAGRREAAQKAAEDRAEVVRQMMEAEEAKEAADEQLRQDRIANRKDRRAKELEGREPRSREPLVIEWLHVRIGLIAGHARLVRS